jgi:hypothetical protein
MKKAKAYLVIYLIETDGDIFVGTMTGDEIRKLAKKLDRNDFAIIDGTLIKSFDNKTFDLTKL